jgi:beta-N-acetylhexosaminidase
MIPAIFGIESTTLGKDEAAFLKDADPAGYILFGRNVADPDQVRALTDSLRDLHGRRDLLISVDQEGGRVQRMKQPGWPAYPAPAMFAQLWETAPASAIEAARANAQAMAIDLAEAGINVNFHAPLDLLRPETDGVIGDRALGSEGRQIAALGRAILDGHARAGVAGCIKHMPGHGRATCDSHKALPVVDASRDELEADFAPFRTLADAPIGMSAHIVYTALDADRPATQSPVVLEEIIRGEIGFAGLLLSDDLDMEALEGAVPERAARAVEAGCDIALNCWAKMDDMIGIAKALPTMGAETRQRLDSALRGTGSIIADADRAFLIAKRDSLLEAGAQSEAAAG